MILVRHNELACRNEWAQDLWEPLAATAKNAPTPAPDGVDPIPARRERPATEDEIAAVLNARASMPDLEIPDPVHEDVVVRERPMMSARPRSREPKPEATPEVVQAPDDPAPLDRTAVLAHDTRTAIIKARDRHRSRLGPRARPVERPLSDTTDSPAPSTRAVSADLPDALPETRADDVVPGRGVGAADERPAADPPPAGPPSGLPLRRPTAPPLDRFSSVPERRPDVTLPRPEPKRVAPPVAGLSSEDHQATEQTSAELPRRQAPADVNPWPGSETDRSAGKPHRAAQGPPLREPAVAARRGPDMGTQRFGTDPSPSRVGGSSGPTSGSSARGVNPEPGSQPRLSVRLDPHARSDAEPEPRLAASRRPERAVEAQINGGSRPIAPTIDERLELPAPLAPGRDQSPPVDAPDPVSQQVSAPAAISLEARPSSRASIGVAGRDDVDDAMLDMTVQVAPTIPRMCRTCRDFKPAESSDGGWCTNKWAFPQRQMVRAGSPVPPCQTSLGCWWLPSDEVWQEKADVSVHGQPTPLVDFWLSEWNPAEPPLPQPARRR